MTVNVAGLMFLKGYNAQDEDESIIRLIVSVSGHPYRWMRPPRSKDGRANPVIARSTADPASDTESTSACINGGTTARANSHSRSAANSYANAHPYATTNPHADRSVSAAGCDIPSAI